MSHVLRSRPVNALMFVENLQRETARERGAEVRVLHVHSGNLYGGIETFLRTATQHRTAAKSVTMDFALCFAGRLESELRDAGVCVHMLGGVRLRSPRTVRAARGALERLLRSTQYDVVVCHSLWTHAVFAPVVRRCGLPLVHHMHDVGTPRGWIDRLANLTSPDLVVTNSVFTQTSNPWLFSGTARRLVRYPVATNAAGEHRDRAMVRTSLGATRGQVVILQASRMQSWKGQHLLIKALGKLRDNPQWVCWIAGGAQRPSEVAYERQLRALAKRLKIADRIKFLGQRDDVPALMRAADVYCQPNAGPEPFGLVFVEALAARLPVVTTRMGGPMEIVDSSCGMLVPPDARSLAEALRELVDDDGKRARLSSGGPSRARTLCDPTARMGELGRVMAGLANSVTGDTGRANVAQSFGTAPLREKEARCDVVVDLGSGSGGCLVQETYDAYVGCNADWNQGLPQGGSVEFKKVDLDRLPCPIADASAAAMMSLNAIERLKTPGPFVREMVRIVRPGGYIVVTTSTPTTLMDGLARFWRRSSRLEKSERQLLRIAAESGLTDIEILYSTPSRTPLMMRQGRRPASRRPRPLGESLVMVARRP
jgi:glycosyltransferase involved in cell wall biosynthesis/SAM-dependent methyltransferase